MKTSPKPPLTASPVMSRIRSMNIKSVPLKCHFKCIHTRYNHTSRPRLLADNFGRTGPFHNFSPTHWKPPRRWHLTEKQTCIHTHTRCIFHFSQRIIPSLVSRAARRRTRSWRARSPRACRCGARPQAPADPSLLFVKEWGGLGTGCGGGGEASF